MADLLDELPTPLLVVALDTARPLRANRAFVDAFGWTCEELPADASWYSRLAAGDGTQECPLTCRDGTRREVLVASRVHASERLLSVIDVTARVESERRLHLSERRHRLLADNARDVIWTMALDGTITYVSPSVEQVRGFTPEEAMRQPLAEIQPPHAQAITIAYFQRLHAAIAEGETPPSFRGDIEYFCRDGSTFWTEVTCLPLTDDQGRVVEILGVTRDIDARRRSHEAARLASLATLVGGVAHEINNPLAAVISAQSFAARELLELRDELRVGITRATGALLPLLTEVVDALEEGRSEARRIARIEQELRQLIRSDARRTRVKLRDVIEHALRWLPEPAPEGTVSLEDHGAPELLAHEPELVQVVVQLVRNAQQSAREGTPVKITVKIGPGVNGGARLVVTDNGIGMAPETLAKAFDPFFTARPVGTGKGLGLCFCHAVVTDHGGTIDAVSELGRGSSFRVELPVAIPEA